MCFKLDRAYVVYVEHLGTGGKPGGQLKSKQKSLASLGFFSVGGAVSGPGFVS